MRIADMIPGHTTTCEIVDVGVDWLTVTANKDHDDHETTLASWYDVFGTQRYKTGEVSEASFLGYVGIKTDGMFIGTRYDGAMLRLSGTAARDNFLSVIMKGATATRIDVQVTCHWIGTGLHPPRLAALHAESQNELLPSSRQRNIEERKDNRGGYTTYIGSRQSAAFARVYHKSAQDPDAYGPDVYRYEVQFNKDTATQVLETLKRYEDNLDTACTAIVWDWLERRGVIAAFRRSDTKVIVSRETLPPTEADRKLAWLHAQVRPTLALLVEQGLRKEAIIALMGIDLGKEVEYFLATQLMQAIEGRKVERDQAEIVQADSVP